MTFSSAVSWGRSWNDWKTKPSSRCRSDARASSSSSDSAWPSSHTSPLVGRSSPARRPRSVVLPDPDAPTTATASPGSMAKPTSSRIVSGSCPLVTILVSRAARSNGWIIAGFYRAARLAPGETLQSMQDSAMTSPPSSLRPPSLRLPRRFPRNGRGRGAECTGRGECANASGRRRFDLCRLRPAARHRLGRPPRGASSPRRSFPTASSTRASPATRRRAERRGLPSAARRPQARDRHRRARRQRRPARRQPCVDPRQSGRDGLRRAAGGSEGAPHRHEGAAQLWQRLRPRVRRAVRGRRQGAPRAARSVLLRRVRRAQRAVPGGSHPSDRGGAAPAPRQRLARPAAAHARRGDDRPRRAAPRPQGADRGRPRLCRAHRRAQPVRVRRGPPARCREPSGAGRRRARPHRNAACAVVRVRREARRRRARRAQHRGDARGLVRGEAPRLGAARLLLARRPAEPLARARDERDRLARRAARRRLSCLSPARRRAARGAAFALSLRGRVRAHRLRQEPADHRPRPGRSAGARSRSDGLPSRLAAGRPARRPAADAEIVRYEARVGAGVARPGASRLRRIGEPEDRHGAAPRRAADGDARRALHPRRAADAAPRRAPEARVRPLPLRPRRAVRAARAPRSAARQEDDRALDRRGQGRELGRARRRAPRIALRPDVSALDEPELSAQRTRGRRRVRRR